MSGHPPPPTFGTSFNPENHMQHPVSPQYSYPYQYSNDSYLYSHGQTNGMPRVPRTNANAHSFHSNAQDVTPSSGYEGNGGPYPPFGGQFQHGAFQPAVFPPTSFAHGAVSYEAQNLTQPSTDSNLPPYSRSVISDPNLTADVSRTDIGDSTKVLPALSELEDGELDDGEVQNPIRHSRASTTTSSGMLQYKQHEKDGFENKGSAHHSTNTRDKPLPGLGQGSTPSQHDPISTRNGTVNNSDDVLSTRTTENTSAQQPFSKNKVKQGSKNVNMRLVDQKIEDAKSALRDLHSQGFDFDRIVNEGLNPGVLLKLYTSLGIPVTASSKILQPKNMESSSVSTDVPTESIPTAATTSIRDEQPILARKDSNGEVLGNKVSPTVVEETKIDSQPASAAAKNEARPMQNQAISAKSLKHSILNPFGKTPTIKAGESRILDRKEYIARMLAAKAGKPASGAPTHVSPKTSTTPDLRASAQAPPPEAAPLVSPNANQPPPNESVDTVISTQKEDSDVEAKRKAQTDLARQKIEALKLRENTLHQSRSATSHDGLKHSQQSSAQIVSNVPTEIYVPISRPLPSRQSSYFSPASQKPPFSIPGLFMTLDYPEPVDTPQPLPNESSAMSRSRVDHPVSNSSREGVPLHVTVSAKPSTADKTQSPEKSPELNLDSSAAIAKISSIRKRQKASDFIDSPSTRVKRPLGQEEATSLIIDISDDEFSKNSSDDESLDIYISDRPNTPPRSSQAYASGIGKEISGKSLVSLADFPPSKKSGITPPAAQLSGQSGDLQGLKSKEMEIEVMNRKIAELEQRIATKARRNTSRSNSPRTSSRVTTSPTLGEVLQPISGIPNVPLSVSNSQDDDLLRDENRKSSIAPAKGNDHAAAEQLNAEQQLEQVELAKAEAERSLAAEINRGATGNHSLVRTKTTQSPQVEESSIELEGEQRLREETKRIQSEEQQRLEENQIQPVHGETQVSRQHEVDQSLQEQEQRHSQESHGVLLPEQERTRVLGDQWQARESELEFGLPLLDAEIEKTRNEVDQSLQEQEQRHSQETQEVLLPEQERTRVLDDQWQARKSEIELGLPLLDAEVEKTRKRLECLRKEMVILETELQKGIEGRQCLIEELINLSSSGKSLVGSMDLDSSDASKHATSIEGVSAVRRSITPVEMVPNATDTNSIQFSGTFGNGRVMRGRFSPKQAADDRTSIGDLEEDTMDLSRSDVDEADSLHEPQPRTKDPRSPASTNDADDENYEPPSEINIIQPQELDSHIVSDQNHKSAKDDLAAITQNRSPAEQDAKPAEKPFSDGPSHAAHADVMYKERSQRSQSRSPSLTNASDPDDYEPPEPALLGEEKLPPVRMSSVESEISFSPPDVDLNDNVAPASSDLKPATSEPVHKFEPNRATGYFTPYQSPLKQFKSFRYHPQYLEEVSNGFRSLTYSHTINPLIPLCRYELDGVCNDDSCQSQHFRSIGLSDDKILVDLGAKPDDSSSPDKSGNGKFGDGLREVIHDIRSRKVRDFNIVAGEITAYRAKFLGDRSKILPL